MSGSESALQQFVDGGSVHWRRLAAVASGIVSVSFFGTIADEITRLFQTVIITPIRGVGEFLRGTILIIGGIPIRGFDASAREMAALIENTGLFAFVAAILVAAGIALLLAQWRRVA